MEKVFEIYIRTTPERIWEAIADEETRKRYTFQPPPGVELGEFASGETVESDRPRRLVETMTARWSPDVEREGETRITYEILPWGDEITGLRVTHGDLSEDANPEIYGGWPQILSSLKSLLETGEALKLEIPQEAVEEWQAARGAA
jgi:uncharacterized protein YndB with AHSA1/START domain